jgi:hypothetical protein
LKKRRKIYNRNYCRQLKNKNDLERKKKNESQ